MFLIPFLMARLTTLGGGDGSPSAFLLCNLGVLLMPVPVWREVYGWVSGFGNYALSVLAFLVWLTILQHVERNRRHLGRWSALLFLLTLGMGLFLEHLTLLFLGACLILVIYAATTQGKPLRLPFWACMAGAALAVYLMFFNDIVLTLLTHGSSLGGRRSLSFSMQDGLLSAVKQVVWRYAGTLVPQAFLNGMHISLPLAVITARAFWDSRVRWCALLGLLPLGWGLWVWRSGTCEGVPAAAMCCLCGVLPLAALAVQQCGGRTKAGRLLLYLSAPLSLVPVAVIAVGGWRFYFFPMVMLVLVAADLLSPVLARKPALWGAALLTAALALPWAYRGGNVLACNVVNQQIIRQTVTEGGKTLVLPTDRYDGRQWYVRNPWSAEGAYYYRERFGIPEDVTLIFLPAGSFDNWPDISDDDWASRVELPPSSEFVYSMPVIG